MAAYHQEVRKLEEKFNGFELHHVLQHHNEANDALARLGSSREQPPPGVFIQDLIKLSIRLDEDNPTPTLGTQPDGGGPIPIPTLGTVPGTPPEPIGQG
jgi:hypothetical protein